MASIHELHRQFLEHIEIERGRSLKTVENYDRYLRRFFGFAKVSSPSGITDEVLRRYRLHLNRGGQAGGLKKKTQNYYLIALRNFLKYLAWRGIESLPAERIELAKTPERDLDLISIDELSRLLAAPEGGDIKALRDRAILELLFSTGLRVSELAGLNIDTIDPKKDEFSVRGKGEKVRLVFLSDSAKRALKNYLDKREGVNEALFVNFRNGERLTPRSIERLAKYYAIKAGISKKVTPHVL
ncbi:MAG: tyrosine-type recombinase/integrase, partial [Patescibacteria group bacterium]